MLPSASKYFSIKISEQYLHILTNNDRLNGLKGITKMKNGESLFQYQSRTYNVQSKSDVNHRGMKMVWNNNHFPSIKFIIGKVLPYGSKRILIHYYYRSDPKLGPGTVLIRRISCMCHACTTILSLPWDYTIKDSFNQPRYGRGYN